MITALLRAMRIIPKPEDRQDRSFGFEGVGKAAEWLRQADYPALTAYYGRLRSDQRSALLEGLCLSFQHRRYIRRWWEQASGDPLPNLIYGTYCTHFAWDARSRLSSHFTGRSPVRMYFDWLDRAYKCLDNAIYLNPDDPESHTRMIRVLMGLQERLSDMKKCHDRAIALDDDHCLARVYYFMALTEKWFGNRQRMMDYVRKTVSYAHEGSLLHVLTPAAHIEYWLNHAGGYHADVGHFRQQAVQDEIIEAYQYSVLSPYADSQSPLYPLLHNYFCFAFYLMGDLKQARAERRAFGQYMSFYPWAYEDIYTPEQIDQLLG